MNRRQKLLFGLDPAGLVGLEIGALNAPVVRREDGEVVYVDHLDTAALREKYREHAAIDVDAIVEVDAVWGAQTMQEALGEGRKVDYVIASHVVEHAPDLVSWLGELESVLRPGGTIRLAIPDKRFCFDYLRSETRLSDVLTAFHSRARIPQVREVIDSEVHHQDVDTGEAWSGRVDLSVPPTPEQLTHAFAVADRAAAGEYIDLHCWAFTPNSFVALMGQLGGLGLTNLSLRCHFDTEPGEHEFFVVMGAADRKQVVESWTAARRELDADPSRHRLAVRRLETELEAARREIHELRTSTSWRITQPMRSLVQRLRRS